MDQDVSWSKFGTFWQESLGLELGRRRECPPILLQLTSRGMMIFLLSRKHRGAAEHQL